MRAIVFERYGPPEVLQVREIEKPTPKDNEVLVRVAATAVTRGDVRLRGADPFLVRLFMGFTRPKNPRIGSDFAGVVEGMGKDVAGYAVGDEVFGARNGANGEYVCVREKGLLARKPTNMTFEEAASVPFGALSALHFLKKGDVGAGQRVLVYGASGAVGTAAVQIAKAWGASVDGVCSTANLDLVQSLGASRVFDYTRQDFTQPAAYDVVFDTIGKAGFRRSMKSLKKGGVFLSAYALAPMGKRLRAALAGKRLVGGVADTKTPDLEALKALIEAGKFRAVIDRTYPLERIADAHRYVDLGHKKGNVVIRVGPPP